MASKAKQNKLVRNNGRQIDEIQAAIDYGIDVSMLIQNMARSYTERIIRHEIYLNPQPQSIRYTLTATRYFFKLLPIGSRPISTSPYDSNQEFKS